LDKKYSSSSQYIGDLDVLVDIGNTSCDSDEIMYDDIEEAMTFANDVSPSENNVFHDHIDFVGDVFDDTDGEGSVNDIQARDSFASHDILNDINEAAERKRSSESKEKYRESQPPMDFASFLSNVVVSNDNNNNNIPTEQNHVDLLEERNATIPDEPEEDISHAILDAISEAARSTRSLKKDNYFPVADPTSNRSYVVSSSSSISTLSPVDPPGDITLTSNNDTTDNFAELRTVETDVFSGLHTASVVEDDRLSDYAAAHAGCGNKFLQQTKEILPKRSLVCKQGRSNGDLAGGGQASPSEALKKKWNLLSSTISPQCSSGQRNPDTTLVSDSEEDDDNDVDEQNVSRPWKAKWDDDPFANNGNAANGTRMRMVSPRVSPATFDSMDGSNYDPDSDWDVDDTEVEFGSLEEAFDASPTEKGKAPLRIW